MGLYVPASWPLEVLSQVKTHYMEGMIGTRICAVFTQLQQLFDSNPFRYAFDVTTS